MTKDEWIKSWQYVIDLIEAGNEDEAIVEARRLSHLSSLTPLTLDEYYGAYSPQRNTALYRLYKIMRASVPCPKCGALNECLIHRRLHDAPMHCNHCAHSWTQEQPK